ncbi:MAG: hypothetical protein ACTHVE_06575 [Senegalia sp. (in: firmicutes)]|uniref:hypothetical protein n=1 Tax=Senegalia sp. (in: firmicutes) TaxID=1924098 RepID=UPI003F98DE74
MNDKYKLTLKVIGPTIIAIIFSLLSYKILDIYFFRGIEGREVFIKYSALFSIIPIASILAGMLSKAFLDKLWVSIFNVLAIWLLLFTLFDFNIILLPFLPIYIICGLLGALLAF